MDTNPIITLLPEKVKEFKKVREQVKLFEEI